MGDRFFATEIIGMEAKNVEGKRMGKIDDIVVDTRSGEMRYVLLSEPTDACSRYKSDQDGRKIVDFKNIEVVDGVMVISPQYL